MLDTSLTSSDASFQPQPILSSDQRGAPRSTVLFVAQSPSVVRAVRRACQPGFAVEVVSSLDASPFDQRRISEDVALFLVEWTENAAAHLSVIAGRQCRGGDRRPIVALCAPGAAEGVTALTVGADFAVRPPVHAALLRALIAAYRRRSGRPAGSASAVRSGVDEGTEHPPAEAGAEQTAPLRARVLQVGPLSIDRRARTVRVEGESLQLTERPFDLLRYLAEHRGACCTRDQILEAVWDLDFDPHTNVIDVQIYTLRRVLRAFELDDMIQTVRGHGYRLQWPI